MAVSANCARDQSTTESKSFMTVMIVCCCSWLVTPRQSAAHGVGAAGVAVVARGEDVGEKEEFDYGEDYHQLDDYEQP